VRKHRRKIALGDKALASKAQRANYLQLVRVHNRQQARLRWDPVG